MCLPISPSGRFVSPFKFPTMHSTNIVILLINQGDLAVWTRHFKSLVSTSFTTRACKDWRRGSESNLSGYKLDFKVYLIRFKVNSNFVTPFVTLAVFLSHLPIALMAPQREARPRGGVLYLSELTAAL